MRNAAAWLLAFTLTTAPARAQAPPEKEAPPQPSAAPAAPTAPPAEAAPPKPEPLRTFDPSAVRLAWSGGRWALVADGAVLKDFGAREVDARQALRLIHDLRLNQYGTVGGPQPVMEYWLSDGRAPQTLAGGTRTLPLDARGLRVEQVQGEWCLRDAQRVLFNFGPQADDARRALEVVRQHGFSQVAMVGVGTPSMLVFTARPGAAASHAAPSLSSGRQLTTPRIPRKPRTEIKEAPDKPAPGSPRAAASALSAAPVPALHLATPPATANAPGQPAWREQPHFGARRPEAPAAAPSAQRVPFDWRQVQLREEGGEWRLKAGAQVLASFGTDRQGAQLALGAMRHYRFTEQWRVGGGEGSFQYFLANGQAPRGLLLGVDAKSFEPGGVDVQQVDGRYAVVAGGQVLAQLGGKPDEARGLAEAIKRNNFDRLCRVGRPGPGGMTFLVRSK